MASQHKIQAYMDKHRLEALFEDLMNKVLRDMPEDPNIYLLRCLYKKSGLDIPQEVRFGGMKRSSTDFARSRTPERSRRFQTSASADEGLNRAYDKPWQTSPSPNRRTKPKTEEFKADMLVKLDVRPDLTSCLKITPCVLHVDGRRSPTKHVEWNTDNKVKSTSFDDIWEDQSQPRKEIPIATKKRDQSPAKRTAWASNEFGNEKTNIYSSNNYTGPRRRTRQLTTEEDLLAEELRPVASSNEEETDSRVASSRVKGPRMDAEKHREELAKMVRGSDKSNDSGYEDKSVSDEDDALELLEDAEELLKEGARHVSQDGYKLSRVSRQRTVEPKVKLNINPMVVTRGKSPGFNIDDSDTEVRQQTGMKTVLDSDDEFESVSQVTGPREPVWNFRDTTDSDVETYGHPVRGRHSDRRSYTSTHKDKKTSMAATLPLRSSSQTVSDVLHRGGGETWSPGMNEERTGGWNVPDDSDASLTEFTQSSRSRPSRDPRAY
ncbi:uncharacterized protein C8orf34 homolog isoform X2 [Patella vulgata]|uniref:uncharacterized protein C8orf34 homolog isoform X2 n=1 Tax=Patella vulgata TaxID=6465 RepID=UPI0021801099|nr:uncharacterized protein C8orf34 homolog isoform X2 [Patella vulgata]